MSQNVKKTDPQDDREYDPLTDRFYPRIIDHASYKITNRKQSLTTIMVKNEGGTAMQSKTLMAKETIIIEGTRMTKYVFETQRVGDVEVTIL